MGQEVTLRNFERENVARLAELANNVKVVAHVRDNFPSPYTVSDAHYWIDFCQKNHGNTSFHQAIFLGEEFVGGIGVLRQDDIHFYNGEIGYWLGEPYWGRNIMTQAVIQMTSWIFENTTIKRLFAGVFETNPASMRVLEKAGYHLEAIHRKAIVKNGIILDEHLFVKLG
ncbi:GNAT family N-acetyltransferase [Dyadobacter luticola]|uniref:GNAT family N-acetyltransferase n=1 Tax=Dyadobacter luticola TaxID=1979387 RepID=A0A5R9L4X0_9BACT|nr:GNAT family N-acetyltransferase [Dyadobacter luticola]TLV03622.1 GNAT family N-acetyltransferase [Dyadobacter luticola]